MERPYGGVVLPRFPKFNENAARIVLERHLGVSLPVVEFWESTEEPNMEQLDRWAQNAVYPLDLGEDKYSKRGLDSAVHVIVEDFDIPVPTESPLEKLLDLTGKNSKTGCLKGPFSSVAWTLRELYKLGEDPQIVVEGVKDVINCFLDALALEEKREGLEAQKDLEEILAKSKRGNFSPFTVNRYIRDMWNLGRSSEEILEKATYWMAAWEKARAAKGEADAAIAKGTGYKLVTRFKIGQEDAEFIECDDRFVTRARIENTNLILVAARNSRGNVAVLVKKNRVDMHRAADLLKTMEPGKWYFQVSTGALLNGSDQYLKEPTSLWSEPLMKLLKGNVTITQGHMTTRSRNRRFDYQDR